MLDGRSARGVKMNTMFDVYNNFSDLYDELVNHEDYQKKLYGYLSDNINWNKKSVVELGVGTGRVTKLYIRKIKSVSVFDNSMNMLNKAKINLNKWNSKIQYEEMDNKDINKLEGKYDILIEGWSFGHLIVSEKENKEYWINHLIENSIRLAREKVIFIETLGTNVGLPNAPGDTLNYFYEFLKKKGFEEKILETDYKFSSYDEAGRIMGSFFGDSMKADIIENKKDLVKEYTGVWIYSIE